MKQDEYLKRAHVQIERVFDAPPQKVYRAWTNPELMARWMWAGLGTDPWAECELRIGGAYRVYAKIDGGRHQGPGWSGMCGLFIDIVPNERLVYTLHWDANVGDNQGDGLTLDEVVSVSFAAEGAQTRMTFLHLGIPDDGVSVPTHRVGEEQSFELLAALLSEQ